MTNEQLKAENARLKAEVAYLKGEEYPYTELGSMMPKYLLEHWVKENARLKAEVERLRKAGDAMALCITEFRCGKYGNALDKVGGFYVWQDWLAAKEGKKS